MKETNKQRGNKPAEHLAVVPRQTIDREPIQPEPPRDNRVHVPRVSMPDTDDLKPSQLKYIAVAVAAAIAVLLFI